MIMGLCYCHTCKRGIHHLGINRHRAMHREKSEDCVITYTYGDTYTFKFSENKKGYRRKEAKK